MRSLTPVEAALAFAIVGSVLAVSVPSFIKNLHASRLSEPLDGLSRIGARSAQLAEMSPQASAYPASAPLTPEQVPRGDTVTDSPGTWQHPTWRLLGFSFETDHAFSFAYDSKNADAESTYTARAHGDLDGDGVQSAFSISGTVRPNQAPVTLPLEVSREVE